MDPPSKQSFVQSSLEVARDQTERAELNKGAILASQSSRLLKEMLNDQSYLKQTAVATASGLLQGQPRFRSVEGLRAIAALTVIVFHLYSYAGTPEWRPIHGVNLMRPLH